MTTNIIILSAVLISSMLLIFLLNSIVNSKIKNKISDKEPLLTTALMKAILFFCGGLLISEIVNSFQILIKVLPSSFSGNDLLLKELMFFSIFIGISLFLLIVILWFSAIMFGVITKGKDIYIEVANNNLLAVILFCGILFSLTFAAKGGIAPLLDQFIPYPTLPIYH